MMHLAVLVNDCTAGELQCFVDLGTGVYSGDGCLFLESQHGLVPEYVVLRLKFAV